MTLEIGSLDITYGSDGGPALYRDEMAARIGLMGQERQRMGASDIQEGLRSLSHTTPSAAATEPSVAGLRDRLLREARQERIRCLQVARASERWRADDAGGGGTQSAVATSETATQTDPVVITATGSSAPLDTSTSDVWAQNDEEAQMEAIRTIQLLSEKSRDTGATDRRIVELEDFLARERSSRQELERLLTQERATREAVQQQVLCLEAEMDTKESDLQASQRILERNDVRNDVLQYPENGFGSRLHDNGLGMRLHTQPVLPSASPVASFGSRLRDGSPLNHTPHRNLNRSLSPTGARLTAGTVSSLNLGVGEDVNLMAARRQLLERDHKLEAKDHQISQLLRELRQSPVASPDMGYVEPPNMGPGPWISPVSSYGNASMNATAPSLNFGMRR